jgi:hypothetical protein
LHARIGTVMLAAGALALAAGAGTLPAVASASASAATWTVTPGGQYRAQVRDDNFWGILDVRTNQEIHCTVNASAWSMRLRFKKGTGLSDPIGWVRSLSFPKPCFPGGMGPVTLSAAGTPWRIHALGFDSAGQVTRGRLTHMHLALSGPHCAAVLDGSRATANDGTAPFEYNNGPAGTLQTAYSPGSGNLHAYQVTGCRQMLHSGDVVRLFFGYDLNRALTVTSP